ncbi:uncharacterized protein PV06_04440 [Exophiala oligosperma]|uniref:Xylanolytic transcriptional activator regulatory domain-containing protein n=1 Tax=Exophiala oligosperma TaxID=215243 RepID=A0A0D2DK22_9EURO|nr:uncharacterized protein PV06_04440 [Exophiala oligosperma]KIW43328.1 hypothetical protein PV06_04440 [Exophiala oligosperma]
MLRHQQQRQRIFIVICDRAVSDSEAQTSLKDHFRAIFAPNASNEVTYYALINSDAKNEAKPRSQKAKVKAVKDLRVYPVTNVTCTVSSPQKPSSQRPKSRDAIPIQHLLNTPDGDDFVGRFPIRSTVSAPTEDEDDTTLGEVEIGSETSHWSEDYDVNDAFVGAHISDFDNLNFDTFFGGFDTLTFSSYPDMSQATSVGDLASPMAMALEPRAFEIRQLLLTTASSLSNEFPQSINLLQLASDIELLTHTELEHCINLYFANYHRHCPIVHRPSFQPTVAPIPLILGMVALGAMYSQERAKVLWMKNLLDVMEAYIFSWPGLKDDYSGFFTLAEAPDEETLDFQFQLFQGAYLMVVVQFFVGNLSGRRRARRQRFTTVISIARSFRLPVAQHDGIITIPDEVAFQQWIRQEVRVRTMNILLALDSAMGIFNNVPARVNYIELDLQLPCHPEYFELSSHAEMLARSSFPQTRMKLIDAFQRLFSPPRELKAAFHDETLCCWDMLYLIHVLFTHSTQHLFGNPMNRASPSTLSTGSSFIIESIKTALNNWKTLWDGAKKRMPRPFASEMGFETSADSYWTLLRMIVQKFEVHSANTTTAEINSALNSMYGDDHTQAGLNSNGTSQSGVSLGLDFMPLEADCDNQGAHLRKILGR